MNRARVLDGVLTALATLVASWPLTTLLQGGEWIRPTLLLVLLVAVLGIVVRASGLRGFVVLLVQLVLIAFTVVWVFLSAHLWYGLPTDQTARDARGLVQDTVDVVTHFAAPAPTTTGIIFVVATSLALIAVVVDYLAVTRRAPAVAGLPLLAVFLVSAANSGSSLNPVFFLALAFMWLLLLARQGGWLLARWSSTDATPATPTRDLDDIHGAAGHASVARGLGVCTLILAIAVPAFLPHLPPHYFTDGLGRSVVGTGGTGTVGFTQTLDLTADLESRDTTPVVTYRTNDPTPPPLRVTTTSDYDDGRWHPDHIDTGDVARSASPTIASPTGLGTDVGRKKYRLTVTHNRLNPPQLAVPSPVVGADLDGVKWGVAPGNRSVVVDRRPSHYTATYLQVGRDVAARTFDGDPSRLAGVTASDLTVDPKSAQRVTTVAKDVVGDAKAPLGKAIRLQDYLRDPARFTYSLTLAGPREDADGNRLDPISHFLVTKQGYCVQFATAMVMMARAQGIPARMAIGFLPGTPDATDAYTVTQADAHAWPELYLPDLGWTRFEPTPAVRSGEPPVYAEQPPQEAAPGGRPLPDSAANPAPKPGPLKPDLLDRQQNGAGLPGTTSAATQPWWDRLPVIVGALALLVLAGLVVPLAGHYQRRRLHRRRGHDRVEAEWAAFSSRMSDYGIPDPGGRTPRQLERYYRQQTDLDEPGAAAIGRAVQTLERSRYALPTDEQLSIGADTRAVLHDVVSTRSLSNRARAALWPRSGREQVTGWARSAASRAGRPTRVLGERLDDWEARQRAHRRSRASRTRRR